jgi:hypothetical protein
MCPCGGRYEEHHLDVTIHAGGEKVSFDDISQGRCPQCSSIVYKLDLLSRLESVLREQTVDVRINAPTDPAAHVSITLATG